MFERSYLGTSDKTDSGFDVDPLHDHTFAQTIVNEYFFDD